MRIPAEFENWPTNLPYSFGPYRAYVRYIVDGDTLDVMVDVGFNDYVYRTIRLLALVEGAFKGVNAPEKNRADTKDAGLAAKAWVQTQLPVGTRVIITTRADADSFGRYLGAVYLEDGRDLGSALVEAGHAVFKIY